MEGEEFGNYFDGWMLTQAKEFATKCCLLAVYVLALSGHHDQSGSFEGM
jgi:hypothetical protein